MAWLADNCAAHGSGGGGGGVARHLPIVYYLMRGRAAEAAEVVARMGMGGAAGLAGLPADVAAALKDAVRAMPEPMQRLCLGGAAAAAEEAAGGRRALTRGVAVGAAVPLDYASTPAGAVLAAEKVRYLNNDYSKKCQQRNFYHLRPSFLELNDVM
jgi:hypothetical protein